MGLSLHDRRGRRPRWLPALLFAASGLGAFAEPALRWVTDPADPYRASVEVTGLQDFALPADPGEAAALLSVRVDSAPAAFPPMAGRRVFEDGVLRFQPRFPLEPGMQYRATLRHKELTQTAPFAAPARDPAPPVRVTTVTPSGPTLPLNLLKFYLHFSAPMTRGNAYRHIRLLDEAGQPVSDPFLELPEELWNPEMTRLTVLLDPGRIKRGLLPNEAVGAVLEESKEYTFTVDRKWKAANGQTLQQPFRKSFRAVDPDYKQPDLRKWRFTHPAAGTRDALRIVFDEPLDAALARRLLIPLRLDKPLAGEVSLAEHETVWEFRPSEPWAAGPHELLVDHRLEDRAGNSLERLFEEALDQHPEQAGEPPGHSRLPFSIRRE